MRRPPTEWFRILGLVSILLLATTAPASAIDGQPATPANTTATEASDDDTIHRTLALQLTPRTPGEIAAIATFDIPGDVRSLETTIPTEATVTSLRGFSKTGTATYAWDGSTADPRIRFTVPANKSTDSVRADGQAGAYSFVDTGSWALVTVPQLSTRWRYVGDRITLEKNVEVAGEGATGGEIAYLGPHRTVDRTAHGQRFEFIIPTHATLAADPDDILNSVTSAADTLRVGSRDPHVFMIAAPTSVTWEAAGIEYGGSDFWVKADERLADPRNVWLHEYVHTRQEYTPSAGARWTIEAGAEYYAALLSLEQQRIGFTAFRRHLERGTRESVRRSVLSDPTTWASGTPYLKGALVFGNVDRRIRLDSDRTRSMQAVLSQMNRDPDQVTAAEFYAAVEAAGSPDTRAFAERYAESQDVPDTWTMSEHETAFTALPARVSQQVTALRVIGDHRNQSLTNEVVVTTGETVTATVSVSNNGGAAGTYETTMFVNNDSVATKSGSIDAGSSTDVTLSHRFETPGTYTISIAGTTQTVRVEPPARPQVSELVVNATTTNGEWTATVSVTLTNPTDRTASESVPVTLDGETIATLDVSLGPDASATRIVTTTISPGHHTISAGNATATLDVPTTTTTPSTAAPTPGFGLIVAGIALLPILTRILLE